MPPVIVKEMDLLNLNCEAPAMPPVNVKETFEYDPPAMLPVNVKEINLPKLKSDPPAMPQ